MFMTCPKCHRCYMITSPGAWELCWNCPACTGQLRPATSREVAAVKTRPQKEGERGRAGK